MRFGFAETCLEHDPGVRHPENPDRIRAIREGLADEEHVTYTDPAPATLEDVMRVHDEAYIQELRDFVAAGGGNWDPDTVATETTWEAALASAGIAKWAALEALERDSSEETPFSLGRPPGHHATATDAMGFCFLNNAAIAAEYVVSERDASKVAIIDWDVHHGNGIQDIFYDRQAIYYVSLHEDGLYPGTGELGEIGTGDGAGTTMNVPLPPGSGDVDYLGVFDAVIAHELQAYDPDLVLISAGFDAHRHDPISRMHMSTEGYGLLTDRIRDLAVEVDAGLAFILEGGYALETLAEGVRIVNQVLGGWDLSEPMEPVSESVQELITDLRRVHQASG